MANIYNEYTQTPLEFRAWHKTIKMWIGWDVLSAVMDGRDVILPAPVRHNTHDATQSPPFDTATLPLRGNLFRHPDLVIVQSTGFRDQKRQTIWNGSILQGKMGDPLCIHWVDGRYRLYWSRWSPGWFLSHEFGQESVIVGHVLEGYDG